MTFSVLPSLLVARKRASLALMLGILEMLLIGGQSVRIVLDTLAEAAHPWFPEPFAIYRMRYLLFDVYARLRSFPVTGVELPEGRQGLQETARSVLKALGGVARAPTLVMAFHQKYFPHLLFDVLRR